jgi:Lon protease-like protein
MDADLDLTNFSNQCRLFPLPRVVLFPHAIVPLHIFELRYRQMTEDALADDKLMTIVQLRSSLSTTAGTLGSPPVETVGCLGRIIQHERLPDGRFHLSLAGLARVRLTREIPSGKLYRIAACEILEDIPETGHPASRRGDLVTLFRELCGPPDQLDAGFKKLLESALPLGALTDIIAHATALPAELMQQLLAEPRVDARTDDLLNILSAILRQRDPAGGNLRTFPPSFSSN